MRNAAQTGGIRQSTPNGRRNRPSRKPRFLLASKAQGLGATAIAKALGIGRAMRLSGDGAGSVMEYRLIP
jgi:hypothetical protein